MLPSSSQRAHRTNSSLGYFNLGFQGPKNNGFILLLMASTRRLCQTPSDEEVNVAHPFSLMIFTLRMLEKRPHHEQDQYALDFPGASSLVGKPRDRQRSVLGLVLRGGRESGETQASDTAAAAVGRVWRQSRQHSPRKSLMRLQGHRISLASGRPCQCCCEQKQGHRSAAQTGEKEAELSFQENGSVLGWPGTVLTARDRKVDIQE